MTDQTEAETVPSGQLRWSDSLRIRLHTHWASRTAFWEHVRRFGSWFEFEAAARASDRNESRISIELEPEGRIGSLRIGAKPQDHELDKHQDLWGFLGSLGIRRIELDARLERNQIEDVIGLLHCYRQTIEKGSAAGRGVVGQLTSPQGIHVACTQTSLTDHTLTIRYTYCTLRFSRVVHWFEQHNEKFHDHRTLFHVAPRYAVLVSLLVGGPGIAAALILGHWFFSAGLALAALALLGLTYISFMVVGSVEYDNEEKAYNLKRAYGQLRDYTDRIQTDIERARTVQETFLPDPERMPFRDRIEWGASFAPAEEVGGDYFDVAELDETRVAILFSDVSGHGMGAAFITAIIKTTFRAWLDKPDGLEGLARQINANLLRLVPLGSFAAVFMAIYDVATHELSYTNCGHQPEPWHFSGDGSTSIHTLSDARNLLMGIREQPEVATSSVTLERGDTVLFVSDGIVENPNADNQQYGTARFTAFVQSKQALAPNQLVEAISNEAQNYSNATEQSDDRTILALRIRS
ncbi:MAG: PP2C family protein-serine/threonine phosphatase [Planctomycetota bacterium]